MKTHIIHPIPPHYDADSRILILGSFPSVKSREQMFFYGHPQNRFWKVTASVFDDEEPSTVPEKKSFLSRYHIALWDVLASCEIRGADDASIRNAVPNDLDMIFSGCSIRTVFTNGQKAGNLYRKYYVDNSIPHVSLPSTSPANCRNWTYETLKEAWSAILLPLNGVF